MNKSFSAKELQQLLLNLIDIYSPSGKEKQVLNFIMETLNREEIPYTIQPLEEDRFNILIGPAQDNPQMLFLGHIDTVPAFDLESYESEVQGDRISGLGSADMKSGCAAMIGAFIDYYRTKGAAPNALLALVVGEEEDGDGTTALLDQYSFNTAIVGEPTELCLCLRHYSYLELQILTTGRRRHASCSGREHNAIISMLSVLKDLTEFIDSQEKDIIYNIRDVHSSESGFAVPDKCVCNIDFHLPPQNSIEKLKHKIKDIIENTDTDKTVGHDFCMQHCGYDLSETDESLYPLKKAIKSLGTELTCKDFKSHSDANLLWQKNIKPIILGPGSLTVAHSLDEHVSFNDTRRAFDIYRAVLNEI